ncbi:MAG: hypothetical protein ACQER1_00105 [Armatimonadota bacterium]
MSFPSSRNILIAATLAGVIVAGVAVTASAQTLPITYRNSLYTITYDQSQKLLECSSNNVNAVWRTEISREVPSFSNIGAVATPAGPVIVYCEDDYQTKFAIPHFRTGSLQVENSGEPLTGVIGRGWLLNALFQVEDYGAKAVVQLLEPQSGFRMREYKLDINMWGTHQVLETSDLQDWTTGTAPESDRVVNPALKFQLDVPKGFRGTQVDEVSYAMYGPTDNVFMSIFSDAGGSPIEELGEAYMAELGVEVVHRSMETLDNGEPAYLLMGNGTIEAVPSLHVGLVYSNGTHTWVISYTGRADAADAYLEAFMTMLNSFQPLP